MEKIPLEGLLLRKNTRMLGKEKEQLASEYLKKQNVTIIEQNYYTRGGELDLIGVDHGALVFFEVKYRRSDAYGSAADAVDIRKCKRMVKAARYYMLTHGKKEAQTDCRFDVIAMDGDRIEWIQNAFTLDMLV